MNRAATCSQIETKFTRLFSNSSVSAKIQLRLGLQLQGFTEKYGMEYRRAYWDEQVDWDLMRRHEREIFPLLHQRRRFAEVDSFRLYNFATGYGNTDENVFAYSNFGEGKKSLFVYNNRYGDTQGFVRQSVPYIPAGSADKTTVETTLGDALGLRYEPDRYVILHDEIRKQYFIRSSIRLINEGCTCRSVRTNITFSTIFMKFMTISRETGGSFARSSAIGARRIFI